MIILIRRRIARSRKENEKGGQRLVFEKEKEKYKGPSLRISVIGIRRGSIIVTRRRFNTLAPFSLTWYVINFAFEHSVFIKI